jgi:hypothetical protein
MSDEDRWEDHIHIAPPRRYEEELIEDHKDSVIQMIFAHRAQKKVKKPTSPLFAIVICSISCLIIGLIIGGFLF